MFPSLAEYIKLVVVEFPNTRLYVSLIQYVLNIYNQVCTEPLWYLMSSTCQCDAKNVSNPNLIFILDEDRKCNNICYYIGLRIGCGVCKM